MENTIIRKKTGLISWIVFIFSISVVVLHLISIIFPSIILETILENEIKHDPFELGIWAIPVIIANVSFLVLGILYFTKKIPSLVRKSFQFVFRFEISETVALLVVVALIFGYVGLVLIELDRPEDLIWGDFQRVGPVVEQWPDRPDTSGLESLWTLHVKNFFLKSSLFLFENIRIIPFVASTTLILLTYFFTVKITNRRFAGVIAMMILIQSNTFLRFDTIATYSNFWTLLYLFSLYLIIKKWHFSPISYLASIFSKPLTAAFFPFSLFFIFRAEISKRKKYYLLISYLALAATFAGGIILVSGGISERNEFVNLTISFVDLMSGFTVWALQLRFDGLFLILILPLIIGLFFTARNGNPYAESLMFLIAGIALSMPLMAGLTSYNLHPYRFAPLIVFFAIGVGTLFSSRLQISRKTE